MKTSLSKKKNIILLSQDLTQGLGFSYSPLKTKSTCALCILNCLLTDCSRKNDWALLVCIWLHVKEFHESVGMIHLSLTTFENRYKTLWRGPGTCTQASKPSSWSSVFFFSLKRWGGSLSENKILSRHHRFFSRQYTKASLETVMGETVQYVGQRCVRIIISHQKNILFSLSLTVSF